ncbi:MAG: hypothetical protein ACTS5Y_08075 [Pollutimonas bauzanensis]
MKKVTAHDINRFLAGESGYGCACPAGTVPVVCPAPATADDKPWSSCATGDDYNVGGIDG